MARRTESVLFGRAIRYDDGQRSRLSQPEPIASVQVPVPYARQFEGTTSSSITRTYSTNNSCWRSAHRGMVTVLRRRRYVVTSKGSRIVTLPRKFELELQTNYFMCNIF